MGMVPCHWLEGALIGVLFVRGCKGTEWEPFDTLLEECERKSEIPLPYRSPLKLLFSHVWLRGEADGAGKAMPFTWWILHMGAQPSALMRVRWLPRDSIRASAAATLGFSATMSTCPTAGACGCNRPHTHPPGFKLNRQGRAQTLAWPSIRTRD